MCCAVSDASPPGGRIQGKKGRRKPRLEQATKTRLESWEGTGIAQQLGTGPPCSAALELQDCSALMLRRPSQAAQMPRYRRHMRKTLPTKERDSFRHKEWCLVTPCAFKTKCRTPQHHDSGYIGLARTGLIALTMWGVIWRPDVNENSMIALLKQASRGFVRQSRCTWQP